MPASVDPNASFSQTVGLLYVFNLIVGTGALALPKAFQTAGWLLSISILSVSALMSYIAATFIVESLAVANAFVAKNRRRDRVNVEYDDVSISSIGPSSFEITSKVEVSEMASMFLSRTGLLISYLSLNVYLFGDLAIYSTTVPKSMMNLICSTVNSSTVTSSDPCHEFWPEFLTRMTVYRICVVLFVGMCTPMVIVGITKTKYIQLATTISRWTAFILMITLASIQLISNGPAAYPPAANVHGFGSLFGVTVYAFMCHHSLPSLITPMSSKTKLFGMMGLVYGVIGMFYFTLSITGAFAFEHVQDLYTLNFLHDENNSFFYAVSDIFLALFPIFTLTTNYPIVAITLINNVKVLKELLFPKNSVEQEALLEDDGSDGEIDERDSRHVREKSISDHFITAFILIFPTLISILTDNLLLLATVTGSYPGVGVQFVVPCMLVMAARKYAKSVLNFPVPKKHVSPFQSPIWPFVIGAWACFAIGMVTLNILGVHF
ncbi:unnamed protein product [Caenorhabditis auriculariae]|uniref:Amino acid transporter transmembrane domain-containing protein n=1 Tax=Caenorhabditis auriculariae TaxID=2777116 RepID=A0A8S1GPJ5_9PELO|nr:unnamed protein product [Caenorhabditis auriculariae]